MNRVFVTEHARKRLHNLRQERLGLADIEAAALQIPGYVPTATRFRGFVARSGRIFDLVVKDIPTGRLVITVIGK
ncbi:hypothetical protein H1S01_16255 [Heliobacterium chlorum]|uniref:DUF4258 domain-containing protein n=1 Tax=Heliobacterium chlorum TaxID=2698 RepID=A0ABR7T5H7_HELCL|nr:hypothetical protein [Heliobacterium chlorum]MBC9786035.1 hypothetical protein [Heliobacterium chlorum]